MVTFNITRASDWKDLGEKTFNTLEELMDFWAEVDSPLVINFFDWMTDKDGHQVMCNNLTIYDDYIE